MEKLHATVQVGGQMAGMQLPVSPKKRPVGRSGQQTGHKSAVCSYKRGGQTHTELYWGEWKQVRGSEPSPLLL